jgi:hypothetical protein
MLDQIPSPQLIYYVYVLFDWLGIPRYVGKGKGKRDIKHERYTDPANWRKNEFIEQTWIMLDEIPKVRIQNNITESEAFAAEAALIKVIGRIDLGTGPLTNMTDGGDGTSGYSHRPSSRAIMSIKSKNYQASLTFEQKSSRAKLREANMTPEAQRERALKAVAALSPEQLSERGRKGAAAFSSEELAYRLNGKFTLEERSNRLKTAFAKMTSEAKSERSRAGGLATRYLLTSEEQSRRAQKGIDGNRDFHSGTRWINNGTNSKQQKKELPLPEGWVYGRLPYERRLETPEECAERTRKGWATRRVKTNNLKGQAVAS